MKTPERTNKDVMFAMLNAIGGPLMVERFKQEVMPRIELSAFAEKEITETEYHFGVAQMRKELPAFLEWLRGRQLPEPPADWTASQN